MKPENAYSFTCNECKMWGDKTRKPDGRWINEGTKAEEFRWSHGDNRRDYIIDKYAVRCRPCDTHYKRYKRTKRNLWRLMNLAMEYRQGYPKMVTVTLPSVPDDPRSLEEQLQELKVKWIRFRKHYEKQGSWLGGVYCTESTLKVNFDRDKGPWFGIKHHAHIHAVVVTPWLTPSELIKFSESGHDFGLGRASVRGKPPGTPGKEFARHLAHYLSKYVTKAHVGVRSANFGKIIGRPWPPPMSGGKNGEDTTLSS